MVVKLLLFSLYCVSIALFGAHFVECGTEAELRSLINSTLNNTEYSSRVRPIADTGNPLKIYVDMFLVGINDVNEVEQKITSTAFMKIVWQDTFMTWSPANYGGITEITLPQDAIWKPDLALANAFDTVSGLGDSFVQLLIDQYGNVTWQPYQVFDSTCDLVMTYFPFDSQQCDIRLVTWSSDINMTHIVAGTDGFNINAYEKNANWDLVSVTTVDTSTTSASALSFRINLKRKPIFYLINFIIPIVLLSVLNLLVFILPCDSGEKASYAIILFLSFAIFLLIVTEIMPEGMNTIPVMSMYLLLECVLSTAIVFVVIIELRFHNMGEETPIPKWLQVLTLFIRTFKEKLTSCCKCGRSNKADDQKDTDVEQTTLKTAGRQEDNNPAGNDRDVKTGILSDGPVVSAGSIRTSNSRSKLKEFFSQNKVSPDALFPKPETLNTLYDNKGFDLEDLEDTDFVFETKNRKRISISSPAKGKDAFERKQRSSVDSGSQSPDLKDKDELAWTDVSASLDFFFFVIFAIINIFATFIAFVVCVAY